MSAAPRPDFSGRGAAFYMRVFPSVAQND